MTRTREGSLMKTPEHHSGDAGATPALSSTLTKAEKAERDRLIFEPKLSYEPPFVPERAFDDQPELFLELCSLGDPRFKRIWREHYLAKTNKGVHGQQIHFLVWYRGELVGVISGGGVVFGTAVRDKFFKLTPVNKTKCINGIVDNLIFRLRVPYCGKGDHLANKIVMLWEKAVAHAWRRLYEVDVFGFETFVMPDGFMEEVPTGEVDKQFTDGREKLETIKVADPTGKDARSGGVYKGSGWTFVGKTKGSAKGHGKGGLTGGIQSHEEGHRNMCRHRKKTPIKDVYCKWMSGFSDPVESNYKSSWKAKRPVMTIDVKTREPLSAERIAENTKQKDEERATAARRKAVKAAMIGTLYYMGGKTLVTPCLPKIERASCAERDPVPSLAS